MTQKLKAIFIDGPSLMAMKAPLGIELINYEGLLTVLKRLGRCSVLSQEPIITYNPASVSDPERHSKQLSRIKYRAIGVTTKQSADDAFLIEQLNRVDAETVGEIVMVTCDCDFIPTLSAKRDQGIKVFWVATQKVVPGTGRKKVSQTVIELCQTDGFEFVELARSLGRITKQCSNENTYIPCDNTLTEISLKFRSDKLEQHRRLAEGLQRLQREFGPALTVRIVK